MPKQTIPKVFTNVSVDVINAIRNSASTSYKNYVPIAKNNTDSIRQIGNIIMDNPALRNEFVNALVNRIAFVIVTSKLYKNPLEMFNRGLIETGETIEEVFVNITNAYQFNPDDAEETVFKRAKNDVRAAFHVMNYQKIYQGTISRQQLKSAFNSWAGVTDLINKIIENLSTSANYDMFLMTKYLLARQIINRNIAGVKVAGIDTSDNAKKTVTALKSVTNKMQFMSTNYNMAGVYTHTDKKDLFLLITADFDALLDTEVLAYAFGVSLADFNVRKILVDDFSELDYDRINDLLDDNSDYVEFTSDEKEYLKSIGAVIVDRDFFMIFDNLREMREIENPKGLYWNYFLHIWKTLSVSPFAQACYATTMNVDTYAKLSDIKVSYINTNGEKAESNITTGVFNTQLRKGKNTLNLTANGKVILKNGEYTGTNCTATVENGNVVKINITNNVDYSVNIPFDEKMNISTNGGNLTISFSL